LVFLIPDCNSLSEELGKDTMLMVESSPSLGGGDQKAGESGLVAVPNPYTCPNLPLTTLAYDEGEPEAEPESDPDLEDSESDPALDIVDPGCCGVVE